MIRKLSTLAVLTLIVVAGALAGCQTAQPAALTGNQAPSARYTDDKGRFHADLAAAEKPLR